MSIDVNGKTCQQNVKQYTVHYSTQKCQCRSKVKYLRWDLTTKKIAFPNVFKIPLIVQKTLEIPLPAFVPAIVQNAAYTAVGNAYQRLSTSVFSGVCKTQAKLFRWPKFYLRRPFSQSLRNAGNVSAGFSKSLSQ